MLKNYHYPLLLIAGMLTLSACCKKRLYCESGSLDIYFSGFPRPEINTIFIKRFKIGDHSKALDSALFIYTGNVPQVSNKRDTLSLNDYTSNNGMSNRLIWGNDWQIVIPELERTYTFSEIGDVGHRIEMIGCGDDDAKCINEIDHFMLEQQWIQGKTLYIRR